MHGDPNAAAILKRCHITEVAITHRTKTAGLVNFRNPTPIFTAEVPSGQSTEWSRDLRSDARLMWETKRIGDAYWSSPRALAAAFRLFATMDLTGKTESQVATALGKKPFRGTGELFYTFDTGQGGLLVKLTLDGEGKVTKLDLEPRG
jgi:hypothetical protein